MGHKLSKSSGVSDGRIPPWLDHATGELINDIVRTLRTHRTDLLAMLLYGSVARHDERPVDDRYPSDVDLLAIFDSDDEAIAVHQGQELFALLGTAYNRHLDVPRDVKVMFASRLLTEWDTTFVANVARDAIVLWSHGVLPAALAPAAERLAAAAAEGGASD